MDDYIKFQIIDISTDDVNVSLRPIDLLNEDDMDKQLFDNYEIDQDRTREFVITLYGITEDDKKIVINLYNYNPYFYIKIDNTKYNKKDKILTFIDKYINRVQAKTKPKNLSYEDIDSEVDTSYKLRNVLYQSHINSIIKEKCIVENYKDFYYYSKSKKLYFKMVFSTQGSMRTYNKAFRIFNKDNNSVKGYTKKSGNMVFKLYESNINPIIRFIHHYDIKPSSWVKIKKKNLITPAIDIYNADLQYCVDIRNDLEYSKYVLKIKKLQNLNKPIDKIKNIPKIIPVEENKIANLRIASYDIECDSSHGDFPLAIKTFKKLATDVFDQYHKILKSHPKSPLFNYTLRKDDIALNYEVKSLYIIFLICIGIFDDPNYIIYIFTDIIKYNKKCEYQYLSMIKSLYLEGKDLDIENIRDKNNINKIHLKNKSNINPISLVKCIYTNYLEIDNFNLIRIYHNSKSNSNRDSNINTMDFVLSGYSYNKLNHNTIDNIISDIKLDKILSILSIKNIGEQLEHPYDKLYAGIKITTLYSTKNYKNIDKKKYIIHSLYKNSRGFVCNDKDKNPDCVEGDKDKDKDKNRVCVEGDKIIQIGVVFHDINNPEKFSKHIIVIPYLENNKYNPYTEKGSICTIKDNTDIIIHEVIDEEALMYKFKDIIYEYNPDAFTGYNIFGFDFDYINKRASELWDGNTSQDIYDGKYMFYDMGRLSKRRIKESLIKDDTICINDSIYKQYKRINYIYRNYWSKICRPVCKTLSSSGLGDNELVYINMDGRVIFDVQKEVQKNYKLDSYTLDNVSSTFIRGQINDIIYTTETGRNKYIFKTSYTGQLMVGKYITIAGDTNIGEQKYGNNTKFKINSINKNNDFTIYTGNIIDLSIINSYKKIYWCENKDDLPPQEIFNHHKQTNIHRGKLGKYCVQDSEVVIHIILKQDFITNNIGMSNVCLVPLSYIFLRGQGIKALSVVSYKCRIKKYLIPDITKYDDDDYNNGNDGNYGNDELVIQEGSWYEGAIVLEPKPGIYLNDPVTVLDFTSLYPSCIFEMNLSPETFIGSIKYKENKEDIVKIDNKDNKDNKDNIDNIDNNDNTIHPIKLINKDKIKYFNHFDKCNYNPIKYNNYISKDNIDTVFPNIECRFIKKEIIKTDELSTNKSKSTLGIIPCVLHELLKHRSATKKLIKTEKDPAKQKILDGRQLAYKLTANSIYGQLGARTSPIYFKEIAACTTAVGRMRIEDALEGASDWAKQRNPPLQFNDSNVIYGDTDSIFVKFDMTKFDDNNNPIGKYIGIDAVKQSLKYGLEVEKHMDENNLKGTGQCLEYEKIFYPLILISKKRYVGDKYEFDPSKFYRNSNGIVLKRRDNAPIVKYVFGNVIEKIISDKDIPAAYQFLENTLKTLHDIKKFPLEMFVISKTLRGYYKSMPAHKMLADRMAERDPGNKPRSNDRIPYVYITLPDSALYRYKTLLKKDENGIPIKKRFKNKILQGDRIEHIDYVRKHPEKCKIDYKFYITNQIMNPVIQVMDLPEIKNEDHDSNTNNECYDINNDNINGFKSASEIFNNAAEFYEKL